MKTNKTKWAKRLITKLVISNLTEIRFLLEDFYVFHALLIEGCDYLDRRGKKLKGGDILETITYCYGQNAVHVRIINSKEATVSYINTK